MFKHLWVERCILSGLTKKTCILVIVILSSTLAAGIVQDSLLDKLEKANAGGEVETTGGYFCHQHLKFFQFPSN